MNDNTITTPRRGGPDSAGSATVLPRSTFDPVLNRRRFSRPELVEATGASVADADCLAGRALIVDADDRVVAAIGIPAHDCSMSEPPAPPFAPRRLTCRSTHDE